MEKKEGQFALFINKNKQSETHADLQGQVVVGGKEYWVNAWKKVSKNGEKYFSCSMREKQSSTPSNKVSAANYKAAKEGWADQVNHFNDEIPF